LSTTTCCFIWLVSSAASSRATVSDALPGACGTIIRMGREGYACADADTGGIAIQTATISHPKDEG
jgi:hypothetical protein